MAGNSGAALNMLSRYFEIPAVDRGPGAEANQIRLQSLMALLRKQNHASDARRYLENYATSTTDEPTALPSRLTTVRSVRSELKAAATTMAIMLLVVALAVGVSVLIPRMGLADGRGRWLVRPFLYLLWAPNPPTLSFLSGTSAMLARTAVLVMGLAVLAVQYARRLGLRWDTLDLDMRVAIGASIGGLTANLLDGWIYGRVSDVIGIRHIGILSVGDAAMDVAIAIVTLKAIRFLVVTGLNRLR
jgi:lipoprotein signal peptidase